MSGVNDIIKEFKPEKNHGNKGKKRPDMSGENNFFHKVKFWKGKKQTQAHIKKRIKKGEKHYKWKGGWESNLPNCKYCGKKLTKNKYQSCRECYPKDYRGKQVWSWKGGITSLREQIRSCFKYRQWRSDIFTRDNFTCVICRIRGNYLEADHYPKTFSEILKEYKITIFEEALNCEELWNINNGRTLCKNCHKKTDSYGRKYR